MISIDNIQKAFHTVGEKTPKIALQNLSFKIPSGSIFGLIGSNGAGKSTLLRLMAGVYRADAGDILFDGQPVYENPAVKSQLYFIPDDLWFLPQANLLRMAKWVRTVYPTFDGDRFRQLVDTFHLDPEVKIQTLSKGIKRQAAIVLALSAMPHYLLIDETFDGLDPIMRTTLKKVLYQDMLDRGMTTVIASHTLRELEDTCDHLALLHQGGILLSTDVEALNNSLCKVQLALADGTAPTADFFAGFGLNVLKIEQNGSVSTLIVRGEVEKVQTVIATIHPVFSDTLPLNLEEVFTYEMQSRGYDAGNVVS